MWFDAQRALAELEEVERTPPQRLEVESTAAAEQPRHVAQVAQVARPQLREPETKPCASDAEILFNVLRRDGPITYGAAAVSLGWGATRAWQAEAKLRAEGLARLGPLGRLQAEVVTHQGLNPADAPIMLMWRDDARP